VVPRFEVRVIDQVLTEDLSRCTSAARAAIEPVVAEVPARRGSLRMAAGAAKRKATTEPDLADAWSSLSRPAWPVTKKGRSRPRPRRGRRAPPPTTTETERLWDRSPPAAQV